MIEQFTPGTRPFERRTLIRPVSQVLVRLKPVAGRNRFDTTIDQVLRWMNKRSGQNLPPEAWGRKSFELSDIGSQRVASVALESAQYWAGRLDDDDKNVPRRDWITEIGIGLDVNDDVLFGARLICATRGDDVWFDRSIPGFVKQILAEGQVELDGEEIPREPRIVRTETDVDALVTLLERPERTVDVIVLALPDGAEDAAQTAIPADKLFKQTLGAAHVVVLTGAASFILSDKLGREFSTFRKAVRTYRPNFKRWVDEPSRHPLALPQRIVTWNDEGPEAFERWFVNQVLANTVRDHDRENHLPSFNFVRQLAAEEGRKLAKQTGSSDAELVKLYEQDNGTLRRELAEQKEQYDGLLAAADEERNAAEQEANAAKEQAFILRQRVRTLEQRLASSPGQPAVPIPQKLDGFESWCNEHLAGTVYMAPRAYQGARKGQFEEIPLIYKALLLLKEHYVPMRIFGGDAEKNAYDQALCSFHLEEGHTGDAAKFNEDQYTVQYAGRRRVLDHHLKTGNSHDPRYCFRLYFFWDDEDQVVVVGWLPSHLDTKAT
ncbi:hypothetical protein ACQVRY_13860 [Ralstonia pseudosolanacearum]|nr:hypothetical protein [Ralstonia solanacearum]